MKYLSFAASALLLIAGAFASASVEQASALPIHSSAVAPNGSVVQIRCKIGQGKCLGNLRNPNPPKINGNPIPPSGWEDPDCKAYGNCNPGPNNWGDPAARKGPSGTQPGHPGMGPIKSK